MRKSWFWVGIFLLAAGLVFAGEPPSWRELTDKACELYQKGKYDKAVSLTKEAMQIAEKQFGPESLEFAQSLGDLGALYEVQGKDAEAKEFSERAQSIRKKHGWNGGMPLGIESEAFFDKQLKDSAKGRSGLPTR